MFVQLAIEAIVVGITVIIFWLVANFIGGLLSPSFSSSVSLSSLVILFTTGVFSHLFFEAVGLNKWYCNNGNACRRE